MSNTSGMLAGKAVVVTGSGRGIGAACARGIAAEGASVVINDVYAEEAQRTAATIRSDGGQAIACVADVSKWEDAGRLIQTCIKSFGRIDGLVNNAGLFHVSRIDQFDPKVARGLVEVNVHGPMNCTAHAVKAMLAQKSGAIVSVCSGAHIGMPSLGIYGATKGAVASMIYTWALELAGSGVRINGISPMGSTNIQANSQAYLSEQFGVSSPRNENPRNMKLQPPDANAPVVAFLLCDQASHVNGQILRVAKGELQLYTHPALLLPSIPCQNWSAAGIAASFSKDLQQRQQPCGPNWGTESMPIELTLVDGSWKPKAAT